MIDVFGLFCTLWQLPCCTFIMNIWDVGQGIYMPSNQTAMFWAISNRDSWSKHKKEIFESQQTKRVGVGMATCLLKDQLQKSGHRSSKKTFLHQSRAGFSMCLSHVACKSPIDMHSQGLSLCCGGDGLRILRRGKKDRTTWDPRPLPPSCLPLLSWILVQVVYVLSAIWCNVQWLTDWLAS